jgi:cytochrome c-type biogenesis protein CcmH
VSRVRAVVLVALVMFAGSRGDAQIPTSRGLTAGSSDNQEQQYQSLLKEIRCMTCPNQSIADSQASVAKAMQEEIYQRIQQGESTESIRNYLLASYGDYVVYRPILKQQTYFLWYGPLLLLAAGVFGWAFYIKRRGTPRDS